MLRPGRFRLVVVLLVVWAAVVVVRLAQLQIVEHATWRTQARGQSERTRIVKEARGEILTRDGRVLAGSLASVSVCANPTRIPRAQWTTVAEGLAPTVGMSAAAILAEFRKENGFFYLAKDLDPDAADAVAVLRERGVWTERAEARVYPHGDLAGPVIGFVDGEGVGQAGLERSYERTLAGVPSEYRMLCDGRTLPTAIDMRLVKPGRPGHSLLLTIDSRVQLVVEEELQRTVDSMQAKGAAAVVMDPRTGDILAMASVPGFDPAQPGAVQGERRRNRAVEFAIEPGSVFKPIIVSTALLDGIVTPGQLIDCSGGGVDVAGTFIRDHEDFGLLPVSEVIARSSNSGAIRIAHRLGGSQLDTIIRAFGFGRPTGVELPAETPGLYRGPDHWSALSRAGLALGEEITVSPLQVAQAYGVFANGGLLVPPRLVLATCDVDGTPITPARPQRGTRVLPAAVANQVAAMLRAVVDHGTGRAAAIPGYRASGKTGTAQKGGGAGLRSGRHAAWFAGFLPSDHPRFVIVVCVDEPQRDYWATEVAAPAFGRIAGRLVMLFGIPPTDVSAA